MIIDTIIERNHRYEAIEPELPSLFAMPDQTLVEVLTLMWKAKIEVLPVVEKGKQIGVISIGKLIESLITAFDDLQINYQMVIHDLRNPIYNIQVLIDLLDSTNNQKDREQLMEFCKMSCQQGINILEDLLEIEVRTGTIKRFAPVEMNSFYKQCVTELRGLAMLKGLTLSDEISSSKVIRDIDQGLVKRAVQNVIANAVKFSYPNNVIKISSQLKNEQLVLKIVDSGMGIPLHQQHLIFDKFSSAKRIGTNGEPSSGLGLYVTKKYLALNHGSIKVKSMEGKGSKFYIIF